MAQYTKAQIQAALAYKRQQAQQTSTVPQPESVSPEQWERQLNLESGNRDFDDEGRPITSRAGAKYATQVMPATAAKPGYGITPARSDTPEEYNRVGSQYIDAMAREYGGDMRKAYAAYNAGPGRLDKAIAAFGSDWLSGLPEETQNYVAHMTEGQAQSGGGGSSGSGGYTKEQIQAALAAKRAQQQPKQEKPGIIDRMRGGLRDFSSAVADRFRPAVTFEGENTPEQAGQAGLNIRSPALGADAVSTEGQKEFADVTGNIAPYIPRTVGAIIGGEAGAKTAAAATATAPPIARAGAIMTGATIGAYIGGASGETITIIAQAVLEDPEAPANIKEAIARAIDAGSEEALGEVLGRGLLHGVGWAWRSLKPVRNADILPLAGKLEKFNAHFSAGQLADPTTTLGKIYQGLDNMLAAAPTSSSYYENLAKNQDRAVGEYVEDEIARVSSNAIKHATDTELGALMYNAAKDGKVVHHLLGNRMFDFVDGIFPSYKHVLDVPHGIDPFTGETIYIKEAIEAGPVKLDSVFDAIAAKMKDITPQTKGSQIPPAAKKLIEGLRTRQAVADKLADKLGDDALRSELSGLSFAQAHRLQADIAQKLRDINIADTNQGANRTWLTMLNNSLLNAMETTAKEADMPEVWTAYKNARKFWAEGIQLENTEFFKNVIGSKEGLEKLGRFMVQDAKPHDIHELRRAIKAATAISKEGDTFAKSGRATSDELKRLGALSKPLDSSYDEVMQKLQDVYMREIIRFDKEGQTLANSKILSFMGNRDEALKFEKLLSPKQKVAFGEVRKALKAYNLETAEMRANRILQWKQTAMILNAGTAAAIGAAGGYFAGDSVATQATGGTAIGAVALLAGPNVLARLLTSPSGARALTRAMGERMGTRSGVSATTHLVKMLNDINNELPEEERDLQYLNKDEATAENASAELLNPSDEFYEEELPRGH